MLVFSTVHYNLPYFGKFEWIVVILPNIVQLVFGLALLHPGKKLGETFQAESNVMNYKILIPGRASFTYDWL